LERERVGRFVQQRGQDALGSAVQALAGDQDLRPSPAVGVAPPPGGEVAEFPHTAAVAAADADRHDDVG
jgi:hypothetical protein